MDPLPIPPWGLWLLIGWPAVSVIFGLGVGKLISTGMNDKPGERESPRLAQARADAWQAWLDAKHAGDTRRQNEAHRAYRSATHAALRAEIGR